MHFTPHRLALFLAVLLAAILPARADLRPLVTGTSVPPLFLTGTADTDPNPYYFQTPFNTVPVGKTAILPIVVSGSGPMTYTATSSSSVLAPIIKTGYPVMNIQVSYSGTTAVSGSVATLYSFTGGADGGNPFGGLLQANDGNLYGTTETGSNNAGTVFQMTTTGASPTTLHAFTGGADGGNPFGGLVQGSTGNLFGTTETGGTGGAGTVFHITTSGSLNTLYSFTGGADGGNPYATLFKASDGNLYGTTSKGGTSNAGTVFQLVIATGSLNTLYSFTGGADGGNPQAPLTQGSDGNLYGATVGGGANGDGTVFQITTTGTLTTLYPFTGGNDGKNPYGGLVQTPGGAFFGTTETGGTNGFGTIYRLATTGSVTTLYSFTGGADGGNPYAGLVVASDSNYYGTAVTSGTFGAGTIFQITSGGAFTELYDFTGGNDGGSPYSGVIQGTDGNLYGTAEIDGTNGKGAVYKLPTTITAPFSGAMTFALLRDMAPVATGYVTGFAEAGYYNNKDFFRITNLGAEGQTEFIAQAGDPTETGTGTPGFSFDNESVPSLLFTGEGQLAMANAGTDQTTFRGTNGSQFFITQNQIRSLDFNYTIFGQLLQGFDIMEKVMAVATGTNGETPTVPVVMNSVTIGEDSTDAVLLISAAGSNPNGTTIKVNATDPAGNKAAILSGTIPNPGLSLLLPTYDDVVDDPPIIVPQPNVFSSLHQRVSIPIQGEDLEFDFLSPGAELLSGSTASVSTSGKVAVLTPNPSQPVGGDTVGIVVSEPVISGEPQALSAVSVGLGSGKLTALPGLFAGSPGASPITSSTAVAAGAVAANTTTFGSFICSNPGVTASDFSATINWGDGTAISGTSAVTVVKSSYQPMTYNITAGIKNYNSAGIYPIVATVTQANGGVLQVQSTAVISNSNVYAYGRTFTAVKGSFDGLVATFVDSRKLSAVNYTATINWGDGSVKAGNGIVRGSNGSYQIYGKHKYTGGTTYPVDVTITAPSGSGFAWSIAKLSGVATHQPPFAQSHITGELSSAGFGPGFLDEDVTLLNSGNVASGPITLKFYFYPSNTAPTASQLSADPPVPPGSIPMKVGNNDSYKAVSIAPGASISGVVSEIFLPSAAFTSSGFVIMQVITSDPLAGHMDYPHATAISE